MAAFQPYTGAYSDERQTVGWSCYATCRVYEVRGFDDRLPDASSDRKWVVKQEGSLGPRFALLVDAATTDFSQILTQLKRSRVRATVEI